MMRLEFKYSKTMAFLIVGGFPVLFALSIILPCSCYLMLRKMHLSVAMRLDAAFVGALGMAFGYLLFSALRSWRSLFESYFLDEDGLRIESRTTDILLEWGDLRAAHYKKLFGQIYLRFDQYPHSIVLNNTDMDIARSSLVAALGMIERKWSKPVSRSLL